MIFPAGRYVVIEGVKVSIEHTLEVSSPFYVAHSRAFRLADGTPGALIAVLVEEKARVVTHRNGKSEVVKEGD